MRHAPSSPRLTDSSLSSSSHRSGSKTRDESKPRKQFPNTRKGTPRPDCRQGVREYQGSNTELPPIRCQFQTRPQLRGNILPSLRNNKPVCLKAGQARLVELIMETSLGGFNLCSILTKYGSTGNQRNSGTGDQNMVHIR